MLIIPTTTLTMRGPFVTCLARVRVITLLQRQSCLHRPHPPPYPPSIHVLAPSPPQTPVLLPPCPWSAPVCPAPMLPRPLLPPPSPPFLSHPLAHATPIPPPQRSPWQLSPPHRRHLRIPTPRIACLRVVFALFAKLCAGLSGTVWRGRQAGGTQEGQIAPSVWQQCSLSV